MDLFDHSQQGQVSKEVPLAARMRPRSFSEFVGQDHIVGEGRVLRKSIEIDQIPSIVFWGPPGSGKTTLANIIASITKSHFSPISAVAAGVADLRRIVEEAKERRKFYQQRTILFIDEIHRFNKAQQDAILPYVEDGTIILIGATTENPSFEVISPLLSRCRVFTLNQLNDEQMKLIVRKALEDKERGFDDIGVELEEDALDPLIHMSNGDARIALNALELAASATRPSEDGKRRIDLDAIEGALQHRALTYDKGGEEHYNIISALHKSLRDSDPDAALYWLGRMLEAGEDPLYIVRRLIRFASEDVGMADPHALVITTSAQQAVHFLGMPEGNLVLAQAVVYLASAPKSNSLYKGYSIVQQDVEKTKNEPVPLHLRNPVTRLMRQVGYGKGYKYAHNFHGHFVEQQHLPDSLQGKRYYEPTDQGFEKEVDARLKRWRGKPQKEADP